MILGVLVLVLCDLLNLSDSSPSPLFNLLGGGNDNDNSNGGGCRPGYEYITETTYQTSYQQQCSTQNEQECSTEYDTQCTTEYETDTTEECTTVNDVKYETQYENE